MRDLTCFLGGAFPIEPVSIVEVMVLKGKAREIKAGRRSGFIGRGVYKRDS